MKTNKLIIFLTIMILIFVIIVFGIGINFKNPIFFVDVTSKALLVEDDVVKELLDPGLHIRIFGDFQVYSYPTQRMFRLKKKVEDFENVLFPDSIKIIEIPWNVFDPKKFYKEIGLFEENRIHNMIESKLNTIEATEDSIDVILGNLNNEIRKDFSDFGIKIYDFNLKSKI